MLLLLSLLSLLQVIAYLAGLHASGKWRPSLVVAPATVLRQWMTELRTWCVVGVPEGGCAVPWVVLCVRLWCETAPVACTGWCTLSQESTS